MTAGWPKLDTEAAFARYEAVRPRLPEAAFPDASAHAPTLAAIADQLDGFVLDAFGVLNVGEMAIPGAVERMAELRAAGKRLVVLTNAASYTTAVAAERYRAFGFDFPPEDIVSSRAVAVDHLEEVCAGAVWGAIAAEGDAFEDVPADVVDLLGHADWDRAEAILFLSGARWTLSLQSRLIDTLRRRPRPVVIANPDLVAPRGADLSVEPGYWGHDIQDRTEVVPVQFGKPFGAAFQVACDRLGPGRHAMVGDTLHTDVLGGRAAGLGTVLITRHGLFAGHDTAPFIQRSGIIPDWIVDTT